MILKNDLFTFLHYLHLGVLVVELLHAFSSSAGQPPPVATPQQVALRLPLVLEQAFLKSAWRCPPGGRAFSVRVETRIRRALPASKCPPPAVAPRQPIQNGHRDAV